MAEGVTWKVLATVYPEFVQWVVATQGPLPDGLVNEADYTKYAALYESRGG